MQYNDSGSRAPVLEREKELACIYSISLLAAKAPDAENLAKGIARYLCAAMQYADEARVLVVFEHEQSGRKIIEKRGGTLRNVQQSDKKTVPIHTEVDGIPYLEAVLPVNDSGGWTGTVRVEYPRGNKSFLVQEQTLLESVLVLSAAILRTSELIRELRTVSQSLEHKNLALREVLSLIEEDKQKAVSGIHAWVHQDLVPLSRQIRDTASDSEKQKMYIGLLLDELSSFEEHKTRVPDVSLSPREREIALQIRSGRSSKEIAMLLNLSVATVERHRHNIRKKLHIDNSTVNLNSYLLKMT